MSELADQLRLLLPPVSYDPNGQQISATISAEAALLDGLERKLQSVLNAIYPDSGEALEDWERVLALPDPCLLGVPQTTRQRIQAVISKLQARYGQNKPFFIELARALGYEVTITTFRPARAGIARAGDAINGGDWSLTWRINAPAVTVTQAVAGQAAAGDPLAAWGNRALECRMTALSPAESILLFGYGGN